jgi:co-chaperonin GroES (HSP10)
MKPLNDYVIVSKIKESVKIAGGFELTEETNEAARYNKAEVVAVPQGADFIKKGDIIRYDKHAGHDIQPKDELYTVIKIRDIVYIL